MAESGARMLTEVGWQDGGGEVGADGFGVKFEHSGERNSRKRGGVDVA